MVELRLYRGKYECNGIDLAITLRSQRSGMNLGFALCRCSSEYFLQGCLLAVRSHKDTLQLQMEPTLPMRTTPH